MAELCLCDIYHSQIHIQISFRVFLAANLKGGNGVIDRAWIG